MTEDCLKLTCYFGERHRLGRRFVADELLDIYDRHEIAASVMLRGVEGFGLKHHLRSDRSLTLSEDLPAVVVALDTPPRVEAALAEVKDLPGVGMITLERARLARGEVAGSGLATTGLAAADGDAHKLTVYLGRQEQTSGPPPYVAVCDLLYRHGVAGATALQGVDGMVHGRRQRARFFAARATAPAMVVAVGTSGSVDGVVAELAAMLRDPLITVERVRICKRDGLRFSAPDTLAGTDEHGLPLWQQLSVFTSEAARHDGQPVHRAVTRMLRSTGAGGVTTVRGVWGYHGDHAPHGDRPLRIGRHVPTMTVVVDSPQRIAEAFSIIDPLTSERGLVTAEVVPAMHARSGSHQRGGLHLARRPR